MITAADLKALSDAIAYANLRVSLMLAAMGSLQSGLKVTNPSATPELNRGHVSKR